MEVSRIDLRKIYDSRGEEAVEAKLNGSKAEASNKFFDMPQHLDIVEEKLKRLEGEDLTQEELDNRLKRIDGTENFSSLGCAATAVSMAFKNASGYNYGRKFPIPISPVVGESGKDSRSISQFLVAPVNAITFPEAVKTNLKIFKDFKDRYGRKIQGKNSEGSLMTSMDDQKTLRSLKKIAEKYGARIGLNISAESFYDGSEYNFRSMRGMDEKRYFKFVQKLIDDFEIVYIENPFHADDFRNHAKLSRKNPELMVSGSELISSKKERLEEAEENGACNTVVISPAKFCTISRMNECLNLINKIDYEAVIETNSFLSNTAEFKIALEEDINYLKAQSTGSGAFKINKMLELWERVEDPVMYERS